MSYDPIIEASSINDRPKMHFLDVRDAEAFSRGHAPRSVRVPIEDWEVAARTGETSFDNVDYWQKAIAELGIGERAAVLVYDDGRMTEAARVWFILQHYGVETFILNGGWPEIAGRPELLDAARPPEGGAFKAIPGSGRVGLVDRQILKAKIGSDVRIFDARTRGEFDGRDLRRNSRGGHLPGATLLPHADLLNGNLVRSPPELKELLSSAGFEPGAHIITHCDGGGRAALAAAAAARAGFEDVRAYYLSFSDWAKDEACQIVT
ncbi:sulfurtransferase (plasmid) [Rhizobium leguminosarum]|uniref:sulfurtransferase n=1 Tax=Rhizobium leguminosarum TaxID=384 RepID=UPI003CFDC21C